MLYSISWVDNKSYQVIGTMESVFQIANLFESKKIMFSVSDTRGFRVGQKTLGYGGFVYWETP